MEEVLTPIALGVLGGLARATYGLFKSLNNNQNVRIGYFCITLVTGGILGGLLGSFFDLDYHLAAMGGYVGSDIIEGIAKNAIPSSVTLNK